MNIEKSFLRIRMKRENLYSMRRFATLMICFIFPFFSYSEDSPCIVEVTGFGKTENEAVDDALRTARRQSLGLLDSDVIIRNDEISEYAVAPFNNAIVESWERIGCPTQTMGTGQITVVIRARIRNLIGKERENSSDTGNFTTGNSVSLSGGDLYAQIVSLRDVADEFEPVLANSFKTAVEVFYSATVGLRPDGTPDVQFNPETRNLSIGVEVSITDHARFSDWMEVICDRLGRMCDRQVDERYSGDLSFKENQGMLLYATKNRPHGYFGYCFYVLVPRRETRWDFTESKNYFRLRRFYFHKDKTPFIKRIMERNVSGALAIHVLAKDISGAVVRETKKTLPASFLFTDAPSAHAWRIMPGWTALDRNTGGGTFRTYVTLGPLGDEELGRIETVESEVVSDGI